MNLQVVAVMEAPPGAAKAQLSNCGAQFHPRSKIWKLRDMYLFDVPKGPRGPEWGGDVLYEQITVVLYQNPPHIA